ncbi:MAG TPA: low temperature requirement protein A [Ilumatobacteraceae bacterium]|jgi:low temperature requirement protein LtrA
MTDDTARHATNLELFLDLVFVFAVTQIASLVRHDLTITGAGRGLLIAWLVWWQWSQFTWAGSATDLQERAATRVLVLCTIPATLTMAVSIPNVFHETVNGSSSHDAGPWFGVAYMAVQLLVLAMQGTEAWRDRATRQAFIDFVSYASIAPLLVTAGGFAHDRVRLGLWIVAALVNVASAVRGASGEWVINPVHFAERHTLFVIICLGEALVSIGGTASDVGLTSKTLIGLVAATSVACIVWWVYFAFIPDVAEHMLERATSRHRGRAARDLFTFGHFPIVAGIIAYAVVVKEMVADAARPLPHADRLMLIASLAMLIGGCLHIQWRVVHELAPERFVAIAAIAAWLLIGSDLRGSPAVGGVAVILAVMQSITWRHYRGTAVGDAAVGV